MGGVKRTEMSEILDAVWKYSLYVKELSAIFLCVLLTLQLKKRDQRALKILLAAAGLLFVVSYFLNGILGVV